MRRRSPTLWALPAILAILALVAGCGDPLAGAADLGSATDDEGTAPELSPDDGRPGAIQDLTPPDTEAFWIDAFDPDQGPIEGLVAVSIEGGNFGDTMQVRFGESQALSTFTVHDGLLLTYAPPRPPGLVDLQIVDLQTGQSETFESAFLYENPLGLAHLEPATGHVQGGQPVVLTGTGFTADTTVVFGQRKAIGILVIDESTIHCISPEGDAVGPVDVSLSGERGNAIAHDAFTYVSPPVLTIITPPALPVGQGGLVDLQGDGFLAPMTVTIAGLPLSDLVVHDTTHASGVVTPVAAPGSADVTVTTDEGVATAVDAFAFLGAEILDVFDVANIFPKVGSTAGGDALTLVVTGLTGAAGTSVSIAGKPAPILHVVPAQHTVRVSTPAHDASGPVDVAVTHGGETVTLPGAFVYEQHPQVVSVTPSYGPVGGGTEVTVTGEGFVPGTLVRIGALPAAGVTVVDEHTITAVTPPGTAGLANVRVEAFGHDDTLVGGFAFTDGLDLWTLDPGAGSMAGGTLVALTGSGFAPGLQVTFAGQAATDVEVLSPTALTLRAPPGYIGKAEVAVTMADGASTTRDGGYIYFDPGASFGGTWGEPVETHVNVAVLEWGSLAGVPGAVVVLGSEPYTEHVGVTDANGHITFSGYDLEGPQVVTAGRPGYTTSTLASFDAQNVTLLIGSLPTCGNPNIDCNPDNGVATYAGQVVGSLKGIQMPWGECAAVPPAEPGGLCEPCVSADDCRDGGRCTELVGQGSFCTTDCVSEFDCPYSFACVPMTGYELGQCVPAAGEPSLVCIANNNTYFPASPDSDGVFSIKVPLGEFAVACWSGTTTQGVFEPQMFGVHRHVFAGVSGAVVEGQVKMIHPVNKTIEIHLDRPPMGASEELETTTVDLKLELGSDGAFTIPGSSPAKGRAPHVLKVLHALTGDLWGASYSLEATATASDKPLAGSTLYERDIDDFVADRAWRHNGEVWQAIATGLDETIHDIASTGPGILAVGDAGLLIRDVGDSFATQPSNVDSALLGVATLGTGAAIAVGAGGAATHYDGLVWTPVETGVDHDLEDVWMAAPDDAWAVGDTRVMRFDGSGWSPALEVAAPLHAVWGDGASVWVAGDDATIARWDADCDCWTLLVPSLDVHLTGIWGDGSGEVFFAGAAGVMLRYADGALTAMETGVTSDLSSVWGLSAGKVYAAGARGTIIRWDGDAWTDESRPGHLATFHAVSGGGGDVWAMGSQEAIVGPMLAIPDDISPRDGAPVQDAITWVVPPSIDAHFNAVFLQSSTTCSIDYCGTPATMTLMKDLWLMYGEGGETRIDLPQSGNVPESTGIGPGTKGMALWRVLLDGDFDFDNASYLDFWEYGLPWRAWAWNETQVTMP